MEQPTGQGGTQSESLMEHFALKESGVLVSSRVR